MENKRLLKEMEILREQIDNAKVSLTEKYLIHGNTEDVVYDSQQLDILIVEQQKLFLKFSKLEKTN